MLARVVYKDVLVDPARSGCIGADDRMHAFGQAPGDFLHVFQNTRTRPIQVRAVLKNRIDVRVPKHSLRANRFHAGRRQQRRDHGIRDLIFDDVGRLPRPWRMDDDFHIGNVR